MGIPPLIGARPSFEDRVEIQSRSLPSVTHDVTCAPKRKISQDAVRSPDSELTVMRSLSEGISSSSSCDLAYNATGMVGL